jgi:hypothetical protein
MQNVVPWPDKLMLFFLLLLVAIIINRTEST